MNKKKYRLIIYVLLAVYVLLACYKLKSPGVQYDELLFVNAAQANKYYTAFITFEWGNLPVLLMPYIGALKSYIYYPIINTFGINVWTLRLPVILITCVSLLVITKITYKILGEFFSLIVLILLIQDPTFIYMTRLDVGPNVLELLAKCLSLFFFYKFFTEPTKGINLFLGFVFLALGIFNKLNFLWFINAFYATLFIYQFNTIRKEIARKNISALKPYFAIAASYIIYVLYFILIAKAYNLVEPSSEHEIFSSIDSKVLVMKCLFNGTSFLSYIYTFKENIFNIYILCFYLFIVAIGIILNLTNAQNEFIKKYRKFYLALFLIVILELIQILLTRQATAPWHAFTLYPFFTIIIAYSIYSIYKSVIIKSAKVANVLLISLMLLISAYQISVISCYWKMLGNNTKEVGWSDKIYELIEYTQNSNKKVVSLDWGMHTAFISFDNQKDKYYELWVMFNKKPDESEKIWLNKAFASSIFITHGVQNQIFPKAYDNFVAFANEYNYDVIKAKTIRDNSNDIYILYVLKPKNAIK